MASINFTISKKLEMRCRDWCRSWFPKEAYGFLLGTIVGDAVHVDDVWLPCEADAVECFKSDCVLFKEEWVQEVSEILEEEELMIVGDFHSHTYRKNEGCVDPVQSERDLDFASKFAIFGIVNVAESTAGKLRTRVRWWGPSVKVRVIRRDE